ncbi:MAG: TRAP transporter small permease subunit [Steroidobacteraceae bacterium]
MTQRDLSSPGIRWIDQTCAAVGRFAAWLMLFLALTTALVVIMRYGFSSGRIWLQEAGNWMHAAGFLLASAYALASGDHVRVDVFYSRFNRRQRAWVDLIGTLVLLLPLCLFILWSSLDYVADSWRVREASREAGGLPALYLLKSLIPISAGLLILQGLSLAWQQLRALRERD